MKEYHKIHTVYKRDPETNFKDLLLNQFSTPEFEYLKDNIWVFTEKIDGTNIRVLFDGEEIAFRGKTDNAQIPVFLLERLKEIFLPQLAVFKEIFTDTQVCLYGEGYGAKIQKGGGNYRKDQSFVLFDVRIGEWWLQRKDVEETAERLTIDVVPIIGQGTLSDMTTLARKGFHSAWGDFTAEGIVAKPLVELKTRSGQRIVTKLKYHDFRG